MPVCPPESEWGQAGLSAKQPCSMRGLSQGCALDLTEVRMGFLQSQDPTAAKSRCAWALYVRS